MEGGDLYDRVLLQGIGHTFDQIRAWFIMMFLAVEHMHHYGLYHRDLKLDNILLAGSSGIVKIADFGMAAFLHPTYVSDVGLGTALYMSPQLYRVRNPPAPSYCFRLRTCV